MTATQLSLFSNPEDNNLSRRQKKAKLGRYERLQRELELKNQDSYKMLVDVESPATPAFSYTFVDLFCGAGGMTQGLAQAGFQPIASVELNPIASATHKRNFPNCHHFCGDIAQFEPKEWLNEIGSPEIQLVVGGPPCQGFSVAGKRNPNDERNRLFYEFVRIVDQIKPWYVVMENVPGILTLQKGNFQKAICKEFEAIGYPNISIAILESAAYKVPQIAMAA